MPFDYERHDEPRPDDDAKGTPIGIAIGRALATGPCENEYCPIRAGEAYAPGKCQTDGCARKRLITPACPV